MPSLLHYARLLAGRPKNPIPKRKRQIIEKAEKDIDRMEKYKTERSRDIERRTGVPSDLEKKKKEIAKKARKTLLSMK